MGVQGVVWNYAYLLKDNMEYLFSRNYKDITELREYIRHLTQYSDEEKLRRFIWEICPIIDSVREKYFRMLNNNKPSWELDYNLKEELCL